MIPMCPECGAKLLRWAWYEDPSEIVEYWYCLECDINTVPETSSVYPFIYIFDRGWEEAWLPDMIHAEEFIYYFDRVQENVHDNALDKGFWDNLGSFGEKIALIHSELSEALEARREGDPDSEKIPEFSSVAEELADAVIRIMDLSEFLEIPLARAIIHKMKYNEGRPHKHGKEF